MKNYSLLALCLILAWWLPAGRAAAQDAGPDVYNPVAEHLRSRLDARLKMFVECERTEQFERMYDLLSESEIARLKTSGRGTKADFVAAEKALGRFRLRVVDFTPDRVTRKEDGVFFIHGRIKARHGGVVTEDTGSIEARWEKDDWYFSELAIEID
jgi:hypothetical protein